MISLPNSFVFCCHILSRLLPLQAVPRKSKEESERKKGKNKKRGEQQLIYFSLTRER